MLRREDWEFANSATKNIAGYLGGAFEFLSN